MAKTKILLVDLDNTLLGSHKQTLTFQFIFCFIKQARKEGFGIFGAFALLHGLRKSIENEVVGKTNFQRASDFFKKNSKDKVEVEQFIYSVFQQLENYFYSINGADEFIRWAQEKKYRLVLATNPFWPLKVVQLRLCWAGIPPESFELITSAENMSSTKPSLKYFKELLKTTGFDPKDTLMIGDSLIKDAPCLELGIPFFHLVHRNKDGQFQALKEYLDRET